MASGGPVSNGAAGPSPRPEDGVRLVRWPEEGELLERLVQKHPAHVAYNAALFEACYSLGRDRDCARIAQAMWDRGHRGPLALDAEQGLTAAVRERQPCVAVGISVTVV